MAAMVAADEPHGARIAAALADAGVEVVALVRSADLLAAVSDASSSVWQALRESDSVVLHATRAVVVPEVIAMCDRSGARIIALADRAAERRSVAAFGLPAALGLDCGPEDLLAAIESYALGAGAETTERTRGSVTVVWGPHDGRARARGIAGGPWLARGAHRRRHARTVDRPAPRPARRGPGLSRGVPADGLRRARRAGADPSERSGRHR